MLKPSKLCNLRCTYCYEWEHLGDKTRVALSDMAVWLDFVRRFGERSKEIDPSFTYDVVIHGGEPLLLGERYLRSLCDLIIKSGANSIGIQTNLYTVPSWLTDLAKEFDIGLGVSFDYARGVRLSAGGRTTEEAVLANMRSLKETGLDFGIISVLGPHNQMYSADIVALAGWFSAPLRLLPLLVGGNVKSLDGVRLGISDALVSVASLRIQSDHLSAVHPIDGWIVAAAHRLLKLPKILITEPVYNGVIVINTDGVAYASDENYSSKLASVGETLTKERYRHIQERLLQDESDLKSVCDDCQNIGCDRQPAVVYGADSGRCNYAHLVQSRIHDLLLSHKSNIEEIIINGNYIAPARRRFLTY